MKPMPASSMQASISRGSNSKLTPSALKTSAAPDFDRGRAAVAVFGDRNAAGGGDQRRERSRYCAIPSRVAAGANDVDCPSGRRRDPQHPLPHGGNPRQ